MVTRRHFMAGGLAAAAVASSLVPGQPSLVATLDATSTEAQRQLIHFDNTRALLATKGWS